MIKILPVIVAAVATVLMSGCSVTSINYKTLTPAQLAENPEFLPIHAGVPEGKQILGDIEATDCQAKLTEPVAIEADAYLLLKKTAAAKGANAIANAGVHMTSTVTDHCYTSARAYGVAYID